MDKQKFIKGTATLFIAILFLSAAKEKATFIDSFIEKLQEQLSNFSSHFQEEKVYLQLDRNFYKPDERIWFSGWIRNADNFLSDHVSELLYVELINPKGSVIERQPLIATNGNVNGAFDLPPDVGGIYKIKAYTKWQKNTEVFFERDIQVQAVVFPNLMMKLDFEKKAYGPGATVTANLEAKDLEDEVLRLREFSYIVSVGGKKITKGKSTLDFEGKADVIFDLPEDLKTADGLLQILIPNKGQTESISRAIPITLNNIDLQFFPEGGQAIAGLHSNVAFKALNEFGKPADVEGIILNNKGEEVASFESYQMGMGVTKLWPERGNAYTAKITKPEGISKKYKLPEIALRGLSLGVAEQTFENLTVEIQATRTQSFHLVAQSADQILFSEKAVVRGLSKVIIPTADFPMGISRLTLFDESENIAAERLVFINPHKQLDIEVKTDKKQYSPREKVKMDISVKDHLGNPVSGNFALSVADQKLLTFADDKQGHILSKLFLESELKGQIEEPDFYFDKEEEKAITALDHLMMTQGWRRYDWKAVLGDELMAFTEVKEQCVIAGQVVDGNNNPLVNAKLNIVGKNLEASTDKDGFFEINNLQLQDKGVELQVEYGEFRTVRKSIVSYKSDFKIIMADEPGELSGTVFLPTNRTASGTAIVLQNDQGNSWTSYANHKGEFVFNQLNPGDYTLQFKRSGLPTYQIEKVMIWPKERLFLSRKLFTKEDAPTGTIEKMKTKSEELANSKLLAQKKKKNSTQLAGEEVAASYGRVVKSGGTGMSLDEICVVDYKVPLIEQDNTTQGSIVRGEDIGKFATKSISAIAAATAGMSQMDEGDPLYVKGSRASATTFYVDGIRVSAINVNEYDIEQMQITTGGFPASVGGGVSYVDERRFVGVDKNKKEEAIYHFRKPSQVLASDFALNMSSGGGWYTGSSRRSRRKGFVKKPNKIYTQVDRPAFAKVKDCMQCETEKEAYDY
ncbi:MAG: carboxypeptidase regulatory-like domain-containing protein, partial [Saprospiraceae bacterium]